MDSTDATPTPQTDQPADQASDLTTGASLNLGAALAEADTSGSPAGDTKPVAQPAVPDRGGFVWGTGRRKRAVARVRIRPAQGDKTQGYTINGKPVDQYFTELRDREDIVSPLRETNTQDKFQVFVNVRGGGYMGQAGAVKLGLARALKSYDPSLEPILREHEMLTRDPRKVERKKPGQPGARRRFQFSKR